MIPLYGFLEGDTLGLLILAEEDETAASLCEKLVRSATVRVGLDGAHLVYEGRTVGPNVTVKNAGMKPLSRFDVRHGGGK